MLPKINQKLIPLIIFGLLSLSSLTISSAQTANNPIYLPIINNDPSRWIGPFGGYIVSIAYDPSNPQVVYAGTFGSGMYKSVNGGLNWQPINQGLTNLYINTIAIDPRQPSILYAGTYHSQIYKSVDGGSSWIWSGSGMQDQAIVYSIAIDTLPGVGNIYASTRGISSDCNPPWNGVVYKSSDSGQTWTPSWADVGTTQDWIYSLVVDPNDHDTIYAAAHENGPNKSSDEGGIWYTIQNGVSDWSGRAIGISPDYSLGTTLFYGVWHFDTLYKSESAGGEWYRPDPNIPWSKVYSLTIDPVHPDTIYLATFNRGILKSVDGGNTWPYGSLQDDPIYSIAVNPIDSAQLMAGTSGDGLYRSTNSGSSWQQSVSGINNSMVTSVVPSKSYANTIYASLYGAGVNRSTDQGRSWVGINTGLTDKFVHRLVMSPSQPGLLYALTDTGGLFRNDLNTANGWMSVNSGLPLSQNNEPAYPADHPFATLDMQEAIAAPQESPITITTASDKLLDMVYAPSNPQIAYIGTGNSGVYKSINGGSSWQASGLAGKSIRGVAVDLTNPNLVYAISSDPGACTYNGILQISTNGGSTWNPNSALLNFYSLAASANESGVLYAGTSNGVYRLQAGNWTSLGLSGKMITTLTLDPAQPGWIYAGTDQGAYYSKDHGVSWNFVDGNLDGQTVETITINPIQPNLVYFATKTHGIFLLANRF